MKIFRFAIYLFPKSGGVEKHVSILSRLQTEMGHQVKLFYNQGTRISPKDIQVFKKVDLYKKYGTPWCFLFFYIAVIRNLTTLKTPDLIHLHGDWSSFIFSDFLKLITSAKKVVFTFHGGIQNSWMHKKLLPLTIKRADLVFATGYESWEYLSKFKKCIFQPSGVDKMFFDKSNVGKCDKHTVLSVTYFRKNKNVMTIFEIAKRMPEINFIIIGDGSQLEEAINFVKDNELLNTLLPGKMSPKEVKKMMDKSHLFLLTSLEEGTPTSVMEAMACGLPIVASNAGNLSSIVKDGVNGFVIKNDYMNPTGYMENITKVFENDGLANNLSKNNLIDSLEFDWEYIAANITTALLAIK
jgi:glycosyltransferase involved in cell wall biosynthesis